MPDFAVVIPARYASTRLPGKPLREINGKTMLQHVFERGTESAASDIVIATDDERIADTAESFGATVCMTRADHQSGTERIAEVADILDWDDDRIVVNLQGDEPSPFLSREDYESPNCVKVVRDLNNHALYFSRAVIPYARSAEHSELAYETALHHHGIYAYRCGVLRQFVCAPPSALEVSEQLEQLRAMSLGMKIAVGIPGVRPGIGIDTEEDLERAADELDANTRRQ